MPRRGYSNTANPVYLIGTLDGTSTSNIVSVSDDPGGAAVSPTGWPSTRPYYIVIDPDTPSEEVCSVTNVSGTALTITRGTALGASAFGSSTKSHQSGAKIMHVATAADYDEANAHVNATTAVHGLAAGSSVVGTTDTQTLTNKTLSSGSIGSGVTVNAGAPLSAGGSLVGTSATQTLTNKTLTSPITTNGTFTTPGLLSPLVTAQSLGVATMVVRALSGQAPNLTEWQGSTNNVVAAMNAAGQLSAVTVRTGPELTSGAGGRFAATSTTGIPLVAQGFAGQTADLQQWRDSLGTILSRVAPSGELFVPAATVTGAVTMAKKMQAGQESVAIPVANTLTAQVVTFPTPFNVTPIVTATAYTQADGTVTQCTVSGASATGFTIYVKRTNTTATLVNWTAVAP